MARLSPEEEERYSRQIMLPEIGREGQEKLKDASVFIAGLGGLSSISAFLLAAAGVGRLKIVDMDEVRPENLNRQIIHGTSDTGRPKAQSALEKLTFLNPHCRIDAVREEIRVDNIADLVDDCSVIVDAVDNIETRIILNRCSLSKKIPFIYGGVDGFNGMTSTFIPGKTPCFECLFFQQPGSLERAGVIGPAPSIIAGVQSMETLKLILGMDGLLASRLLYFKGKKMAFREMSIERNPDCKRCGPAGGAHG